MKKIFFFLSLIISITSFSQNKDETQIRKMLAQQEFEWNNGNIEKFMNGYWQNDSLLFIGKNGPKFGYKTTVENYKKSYADTVAMGKLYFDLLKLEKLSNQYYFVVGKWLLNRSIGNLSGYFSLLIKKINGKWQIIADHSS